MWWLLVPLLLAAFTYWFLTRPFNFWTDRGVKQGNTTFLLGNNKTLFLRQHSLAELTEMFYNMFPNSRYSGVYMFLSPFLVVRDPDLIKQITVKDFDHFFDHRSVFPEDADRLWAKNLFVLKGQKWRDMRSMLSPAFTSSKMKQMFSLISQTGERFVEHFLAKDEDLVTVEMKDTFTRFTNDVIANTAFGIECDSLKNQDNDFFLMGKKTTDFSSLRQRLIFFAHMLVPKLVRALKISFLSKEIGDFFLEIIAANIDSREKRGIVRPDMLNLLLEARKTGLKYEETEGKEDAGFATVQESEISKSGKAHSTELTDVDITAQALIFFLAGFDSVAALMCFMSYELAINQDVQERLIQEVDDTFATCDGKITYEALLGMKYMDMVVSESLRKWPNAIALDRICTKPYIIEPETPEERPLHLAENQVIMIPVFGMHRDPQYWPDPLRFDPERFNDENKKNIKPYTYLPFGSGPRNCIGSRFALLETKMLFFYILSRFQIVPVKETQIPLKISRKQFNLTAEGGFWLGLKRRTKD